MTTRNELAEAVSAQLATVLDADAVVLVSRIVNYEAENLEIAKPSVFVVPYGRRDDIVTRLQNAGEMDLQLVIMRKLGPADNNSDDGINGDQLEAITDFVDRIADLWGHDEDSDTIGEMREAQCAGMDWSGIELTHPISVQLLRENRIFQAVFKITYTS